MVEGLRPESEAAKWQVFVAIAAVVVESAAVLIVVYTRLAHSVEVERVVDAERASVVGPGNTRFHHAAAFAVVGPLLVIDSAGRGSAGKHLAGIAVAVVVIAVVGFADTDIAAAEIDAEQNAACRDKVDRSRRVPAFPVLVGDSCRADRFAACRLVADSCKDAAYVDHAFVVAESFAVVGIASVVGQRSVFVAVQRLSHSIE